MPRLPHVVPMPSWNLPISYIKLILAIIVLVFTGVCASTWGDYVAFGFTFFTTSATLFIFLYYLISLSFFSHSLNISLYNRWAILGLEILQMTLWLISMVLMADWVQWHRNGQGSWYINGMPVGEYWNNIYDQFSTTPKTVRMVGKLKRATFAAYSSGKKFDTAVSLAGVSAALAGLEFVLFLISLATFSINLHQHRMVGNPTVYGDEDDAVPELVDSRSDGDPIANCIVMPGVAGTSQIQRLDIQEAENVETRPPTPIEKARAADAARAASVGNVRADSLVASPNMDVTFVLYSEKTDK